MNPGANPSTAQNLVDAVMQLISLPEVYLRLQQAIDDPHHSREQIAEIVSYDPALSARVLRIANSSYYSFPSKIETIGSTVGLIGEIDLRNLVLATTVIGSMNTLSYEGVNIDEFWLHSLRCGIFARLLAKTVKGSNPEILFLAGMLHDLGILVIYQQEASLAAAVARQIDQQHQLRDQAERELMGFDHAEVGALLITAWGLADELSELVRFHHQYQLAEANQSTTQVLALANQLANVDTTLMDGGDIRISGLLEPLAISQDDLVEIITTPNNRLRKSKV